MIVIPPVKIEGSKLVSSTIAEPDTGEVVWDASTSYSPGDVVIRTTTHRKYENVAASAGIDAGLPESTPARWLDIGPTNKYAMFDQSGSMPSVASSGSLSVRISPGQRIDSLALTGVQANTVTITMYVGSTVEYGPVVINMSGRTTTTWSQYFFGVLLYKNTLVLQDLPPYASAEVQIDFNNPSGAVKCSGVVIGTKIYLGKTQYTAKDDSLNFSIITRDEFGNSTLTPRRTVPKSSQTLWCEKTNVNNARLARKLLNAVPAFWSGLDDKYSDDYFEAVSLYGIYKQFEIDIGQPDVATINLELEEL